MVTLVIDIKCYCRCIPFLGSAQQRVHCTQVGHHDTFAILRERERTGEREERGEETWEVLEGRTCTAQTTEGTGKSVCVCVC